MGEKINPLLDENWAPETAAQDTSAPSFAEGNADASATEGDTQEPAQPPLENAGTAEHDTPNVGNVQSALLGRFKSAEELADAYRNLETVFTQQSQVLAHLSRQIEQTAGNSHEAQYEYAQPDPEPEPDFEKMWEKLRYGDAKEASLELQKTIDERVARAISDYQYGIEQAQQEYQAKTMHFQQEAESLPDLDEIRDEMLKVANAHPHLAGMPDAVNVIAKLARAELIKSKATVAGDWRKAALADPEVEKQILLKHQKRLQQGDKPPTLISNQPSGGAPGTVPNRPKTIAEATRALLAHEWK